MITFTLVWIYLLSYLLLISCVISGHVSCHLAMNHILICWVEIVVKELLWLPTVISSVCLFVCLFVWVVTSSWCFSFLIFAVLCFLLYSVWTNGQRVSVIFSHIFFWNLLIFTFLNFFKSQSFESLQQPFSAIAWLSWKVCNLSLEANGFTVLIHMSNKTIIGVVDSWRPHSTQRGKTTYKI